MIRPPTVVVMTRAARPGATKTRLQPLLGAAGCARLQHALITHTARTASAAAPASWHFAVDPPGAQAGFDALAPQATTTFAQRGQDLGARMSAAVAHAWPDDRGPVVLIGTDVPLLTADHILDAARLLDSGQDVVFGPALDGGYYLVGLRRLTPEVFDLDPAEWGGPRVLESSVTAARAAGLTVAVLPILRDLDTPEDAQALALDAAVPPVIRAILAESIKQSGELA